MNDYAELLNKYARVVEERDLMSSRALQYSYEIGEKNVEILALQRKLDIAVKSLHCYSDAFLDITGAVAREALKKLEE